MANIKRNKIVARSIIAVGTLLACLGIWSSVVSHTQLTQPAVTAPDTNMSIPNTNPNFSSNDTFLTQPDNPSGPLAGTQSSTSQPAPAPRFRTRGS